MSPRWCVRYWYRFKCPLIPHKKYEEECQNDALNDAENQDSLS